MTRGKSTAAVIFLVAFVAGGCDGSAATGQGGDRPLVSQGEYDRWFDELSNWGRWGPDDEMGALNLITPEKRRAAAGLVTEGLTVSLASIASTEQTLDNPCPVEWAMVSASPGGASDTVSYPCIHGPGTTHIDGFAHRFPGQPDCDVLRAHGGNRERSPRLNAKAADTRNTKGESRATSEERGGDARVEPYSGPAGGVRGVHVGVRR